MAEVKFRDFKTALWFLKKMAAGMIQRNPDGDGFYWASEGELLDPQQLELLNSYSGLDSTWLDADTGLMWLLKGCYGSETPGAALDRAEDQNTVCFGGHADWRVPTLQELKTLSGSHKDTFGMFVKPGVAGRLKDKCWFSTTYNGNNGHDDGVMWDYSANALVRQNYHEGKIKWGSEGGYAGFEASRGYQYSAHVILVRGERTDNLGEWAQSLIEWAEGHKLDSFPVTEESILRLEDLTIPDGSLPKHFSMLKNLRRLDIRGCKELPDELFRLTKLEALHLGGSCPRSKALEVAFTLSVLVC